MSKLFPWPKGFSKGEIVKVKDSRFDYEGTPKDQLKFKGRPGVIVRLSCFEGGGAATFEIDFGKKLGSFMFPPAMLDNVTRSKQGAKK